MPDNKRTPNWDDLRSFITLARCGRLSAAARILGVNHATVSRRLGALEGTLGVKLFEHRQEGYVLTREGEAVLSSALPMEAAALDVGDCRQDGNMVRGLVRISTVIALGQVVIEQLAPLLGRYPELDFELLGEARNVSLALREADIALRLGRPKSSDLIGRHVGDVRYGFYASCDFEGGTDMIGYDAESDFVPEAAWMEKTFPKHRFVLRSNTQLLQVAAARAGYGTVLLPCYIGDRDPGLKPIDLGTCAYPPRELWLLARAECLRQDRVRVVADALSEACRKL
jgi:DNA-binding transcriptional LysR family regulator